MRAAPDPNQEPTVASFMVEPPGPKPAQPKVAPEGGAPPVMSLDQVAKMAQAAPDALAVARAVQNGQIPDPAMAARVMAAMGMQPPRGAEPGQAPAGQPAPLGRVATPRAAQPARPKRSLKDDLDEIGVRLARFMTEHLPGVDLGITMLTGDDGNPELRMAVYITTEDEPHILAQNSADVDALGLALYQTVAEAQQKIEIEEPDEPEVEEIDTSHLAEDY